MVAPVLLVWLSPPSIRLQKPQYLEAAILLGLLTLVTAYVFGGKPPDGILHQALIYLVFPFIIWAALRFEQHGATMTTFVVSGIAIWGTVQGLGPRKWEKGEIMEVDAVGMGCMLTHRSVFEDIKNNYRIFQIPGGSLVPVHKLDIEGEPLMQDGKPKSHPHDGKVYQGQLRTRLMTPALEKVRFPYFMVEHIRTEDMYFFDLAARVGHKPVLDTSVECTHLRFNGFSGKDYRDASGY